MFKRFFKIKRVYKKKVNTEYIKYKEEARQKVLEKLVKYRDFYLSRLDGAYNLNLLNYKRVTIRDQKSRWGSCSSKGNLNFNYRLILLPEYMMHYVIVHELCHLLEMNHSQRFWVLVSLTIPDYVQIKSEMCKINIAKSIR